MPEFLVGELVRQRMGALSASERRLAQVLLAFYPVAGLESLTRFAERAGVSPATVTRFITKLGLRGYPEFQESLRQELQERLSSPLTRYELTQPGDPGGSMLREAFATYEHTCWPARTWCPSTTSMRLSTCLPIHAAASSRSAVG